MRYAGVRDLEGHVLEHEWKEKHTIIHYGYSIVLCIITGLPFVLHFGQCVVH